MCVAKVDVMWHEFKFMYTVEFLENPDNVASLVEKAVEKAIENTSNIKCKQLQPAMGIINLSPAELTGDCGRFAQLPSLESILLQSSFHVYKYPVTIHGALALMDTLNGLTKFDHVIFLSRMWLHDTRFFKYETVPFDPLEVSEASSSLLSFVKEVATAIEALHNQSFAHQDVRLPNICFSKEIKAVLDRTCRVRHLPEFYKGSVMHKAELNAGELDAAGFGGLATYHSKQSGICYYDLLRQEVPEEYQSDQFVCCLMKGKYRKEHLLGSRLQTYNTRTLQSVLEEQRR